MKKNHNLKEAVVLLTAAIMILSSIVVVANTEDNVLVDTSKLKATSVQLITSSFNEVFGSKDSLYLQTPIPPEGSWAFQTSDVLLGYLVQDNFHDVIGTIEDFHFWGLPLIYNAGWTQGYPEDLEFEVIFYEDDAGAPGAVVATYSNLFPAFSFFANYAGLYDAYLFEIDGLSVNLAAGWVSVQSTSSPTSTSILWASSLDIPPGDGDALQNGASILIDMAFELTGSSAPPAIPDLDCSGELDFVDVEPNGTVAGTITVENIGEPDSLLNWEVEAVPDWGTWTFTPDSGTGLLAGDTANIDVEIIAPNEENTEFEGEVILVNSDDPDDICIVDVTLVTPFIQISSQATPTFIQYKSSSASTVGRADFLGYDDGYTENSWAFTGGEDWQAAIQLTDALLAPYRDDEITEVMFSCGCDDFGFEIADYEIWISDQLEDPTAPPVVYGTGTSSGTGWDTVTLDMAYDIPDTGDVYMGITYSNYGVGVAWPAGVDTTNYVPEGFWFYYGGIWQDAGGLLGPSVWGLSAGVTAGVEPTIPDLDCVGELDFVDVEPNGTVSGTITVENVGEPDSLLDWEVESFPDWGNWTFTPDSGTGLLAGDTANIDVEIIAPNEENTEFEGEVILVNSDDPDDTCTIDVTLVTPVSQSYPFLEFLAQRFPILAKILALIF